MIAVMMEMLGVPALIFALGMYLPLELNLPALVGGVLAHFLDKRSDKTGGERGPTMRERGVIIASGFMAGGALGGVFGAALRLIPWFSEDLGQDAVLRQRPDLADRVAGAVRRRVRLPVAGRQQTARDSRLTARARPPGQP